jgi:hypothetical protein
MAENEQYDNVLLRLRSDQSVLLDNDKRFRTYGNVMLDGRLLDSYLKKRDANLYNTKYTFEDVFTKNAKLTNLEDITVHSQHELTPNNRFTNTTFLNLSDREKEYDDLVLKCLSDDKKGLSDEEYLKEQMEIYEKLRKSITFSIIAINLMTYLLNNENRSILTETTVEFTQHIQSLVGAFANFDQTNGRLTFRNAPTEEAILQLPFNTEKSQKVYAISFESFLDTVGLIPM